LSDESLFREVDEEVRQEQFQKMWARYGNLIIALCLALIVGVAGFKGWQYWQVKQAESAGESFFSAVKLANGGKTEDAARQFDAINHAGYATLAKLREANALAANGKAEDAVKIYDGVAADNSVENSLRDLARIRAALALTDSASPADLAARVQGFDVAGNPWRHTVREIMAAAYWRLKDYGNANKQVQAILADPETPSGIRQRARMLSELLVPLLAQK
jgi:hypothetical protein